MKLRTKIQLFSSLFMLILVLLINTSVYYLFYKTTVDSELDQLVAQTNTMIETLTDNPDIPKGELLQAFLPANGMIRVYTENDSDPLHIVTKLNDYRDLPGQFSESESRTIVKNDEDIDIAVISKPMIWDNGDVVTLQVSEHLLALKETMTTLFYVLVIASVFMIIPTIIAGFVLGRFLLRPINALIQTMRENRHFGKWEKINIDNRSHDEIYEMGLTFNNMIDHIKDNFEKQEIFVSDASHELKTPISIVKSYAQLLERRGKDNPELFKESVQAIDSEADRMQKLVEQMLLLAKSEYETHYDRVNITELCEETVHTFKGAYDRVIQLNILASEALYVMGNRDQLQQVLYILMNNAIKYSDDDITMSLNKENQHAYIRVIDKGQGISDEDQQRIFDRFYRIDKARSRDTGGTGLGLPIAKTIIENHHGQISVMSEQGKGTTFLLALPIV